MCVYRITMASNQNSSGGGCGELKLQGMIDPRLCKFPEDRQLPRRNFPGRGYSSKVASGFRLGYRDALSTGTCRLFACEIVSRITAELCHRDDDDDDDGAREGENVSVELILRIVITETDWSTWIIPTSTCPAVISSALKL